MRILLVAALCAACVALPRAEVPSLSMAAAVAELREQMPPALPTDVRVCRIPEELCMFGVTYRRVRVPGRLQVVVDSGLDEAFQLRVLAHEWAHAVTWSLPHEAGVHDAAWGVAYARAYRIVVEGAP